MFSEVQRDYIKQIVAANRSSGYHYYVAHTNTNVSGQGIIDNVSFYLYLSNKPFTASNRYTYDSEGDVIKLTVRSGSASYNYHSERVSESSQNTEIHINNYEFVYTNANFSGYTAQPDVMATNLTTQSHLDGIGLAVLVICMAIIFYKFLFGGGTYGKITKF